MKTTEQCFGEDQLHDHALRPLYMKDLEAKVDDSDYDDEAWKAEFGAIYHEHY